MPTPQEVLEQLKQVTYPGLSRDIVSFGLVKDIEVGGRGVTITLAPTTAKERRSARSAPQVVAEVHGTRRAGMVEVIVEEPPKARSRAMRPKAKVGGVERDHRGGERQGRRRQVDGRDEPRARARDARAQGRAHGRRRLRAEHPAHARHRRERPQRGRGEAHRAGRAHGLRVMSMGMFVDEATPIIWRGPMITKLITEFLRNVDWGELD